MATAIVAQPSVITMSDWQQQQQNAVTLCTAIIANVSSEQEKENEKEQSPLEERAKPPKVEPILEWQRKEFERLVEEFGCSIYPTREEKEKLAGLLNASYAQITRLFANHRRRVLKKKSISTQSVGNKGHSVERLFTVIKEPFHTNDTLLHDDTSTSERSISPNMKYTDDGASESDDSLVAICSEVADQIHDDIENKHKQNPEKKKKSKAVKRKANAHDAHLEATVDEILSKVSREEAMNEQKGETSIIKESQMSSTMVGLQSVSSNLTEPANTNLLSLVNEAITKPPLPLPDSIMADVNPKLLEAMDLLNKGVSWTHPSILSVLVQILNQQREEREQRLLAQLQNNRIQINIPEASQSLSIHPKSTERSTEEMMQSLNPDEYLAVTALTELANSC